jgi:hypothetical protein
MQNLFRLAVVGILALATGCVPTAPYRTAWNAAVTPSPPPDCVAGASQAGSPLPELPNHERTPLFDLYFVEFDEQGLLYPRGMPDVGIASCHIEALMRDLDGLAQSEAGLSIVVYVHGWKHNAADADGNVQTFRQLLADAALVEQAKQQDFNLPPHRVVGIYVSWRGKSVTLPEPFLSLTFWDRKSTAQYVAEGESRVLFSRLRGFYQRQNQLAAPYQGEKKVLLILMGHSFGGLILLEAVSQSLINSLFEYDATPGQENVIPRFGDMIILANPAVEALRYTPLHRAAASQRYDHYQTPIFVSITSTADWATGIAFPIGRSVNTFFETSLSGEEHDASKKTLGHMDPYITHELLMRSDGVKTCPGWNPVLDPSAPSAIDQERNNLNLERRNSNQFFGPDPATLSLLPGWQRNFCGDAVLRQLKTDPNSPIWNVSTDAAIIPGHNEITQPVFVNFVRQLYHDTVIYPIIVERMKAEQASPPRKVR